METWLCCCGVLPSWLDEEEGGLTGRLRASPALEAVEEGAGEAARSSIAKGVDGRLPGPPSIWATLPSGSAMKLNTNAHVFSEFFYFLSKCIQN